MADNEKGPIKPIPFNHLVDSRRVEEFNKTWDQLVQYAADNGLEKPRKGKFAGDILEAGLSTWKPEDYYNKTRG